MAKITDADWKKPFPERYLACADAFAHLNDWLTAVGMSGNDTFKRLQAEFIQHGADTFADINRNQAA